jgi:hypothetical protein
MLDHLKRIPWPLLIAAAVLAVAGVRDFQRKREDKRAYACVMNVKLLALGILQYAADQDERLPLMSAWQQAAMSHPKFDARNWVCPSDPQHNTPGYGYSPAWAGKGLGEIPNPSEAVMLFDAVGGEPQYRHPAVACDLGRSGEGGLVLGFCDGHIHEASRHSFGTREAQAGRTAGYRPY